LDLLVKRRGKLFSCDDLFQHGSVDHIGKIVSIGKGRFYRRFYLFGFCIFEQVPGRTYFHQVYDKFFVIVHREHQNADIRVMLVNILRGLDTVHVRHLEIHQDDVRRGFRNHVYELLTVLSFPDDGKGRIVGEREDDALTKELVVIGYDTADIFHDSFFSRQR